MVECLGRHQPALRELYLCDVCITRQAVAMLKHCAALTHLELSELQLVNWESRTALERTPGAFIASLCLDVEICLRLACKHSTMSCTPLTQLQRPPRYTQNVV